MKIAVASDHGGYELKEEIVKYLKEKGYDFIDFGCFSPESVDYPVMAAKACRAIQKGECDRGIICCGTGLGISMAANKFKGIRAAVEGDGILEVKGPKGTFRVKTSLSDREKHVILCGGLLASL